MPVSSNAAAVFSNAPLRSPDALSTAVASNAERPAVMRVRACATSTRAYAWPRRVPCTCKMGWSCSASVRLAAVGRRVGADGDNETFLWAALGELHRLTRNATIHPVEERATLEVTTNPMLTVTQAGKRRLTSNLRKV
jgi:hypothetical protein